MGATHFLEQVEPVNAPQFTPATAQPVEAPKLASPETPPRIAAPDVVESLTEEEEQLPSARAFESRSLREACAAAFTSCAEKSPPWFRATLRSELLLAPVDGGSRVVGVKRSRRDGEGLSGFQRCVSEALLDTRLSDLEVATSGAKVKCPDSPSSTESLFSSTKKLRDALLRCTTLPEPLQVSVRFRVAHEGNELRTRDFVFDEEPGLDAYLRNCLELALETRVSLLAAPRLVGRRRTRASPSRATARR